MNEDYLWDKSGEADPEILRLEETLGRLRHKRPLQPLPLPAAHSRPWPRLASIPALAIAATLVVLLLAGGLWLRLHRGGSNAGGNAAVGATPEVSPRQQVTSGQPPQVVPIEASGGKKDGERLHSPTITNPPRNAVHRSTGVRREEVAQLAAANNLARLRRERIIREGELAKEQLIRALLITSDKLNAVQKKIQGNQERGPVS